MSGYYPDGVTGGEYAIAGADREWSDEREDFCNNPECEMDGEVISVMIDLSSYGSTEWGEWSCASCGKVNEYEATITVDEWEYGDDW